jgi:cold shock CspA family protein/ribosome-associated translation inhibitor RaiA
MKIPLQISFSNMTPSDAVEARIRKLAGKLDRFHDRIMSCRVVVSAPNRRGRQGNLYKVSVDAKLPGREIAVNRNPPQHHAHEDVYVAIRDAFEALSRRVEDVARERRGDVKTHQAEPSGRVSRLFPDKRYGFIEDDEIGEVYFHANSVTNGGFDKLAIGSTVHYLAELGEKGQQATVVKPTRKARKATSG